MNLSRFQTTLPLMLLLALAAAGCRKTPENVTMLPDYKKGMVGENPAGTSGLEETNAAGVGEPVSFPMADPALRANWPRNREIFKADTVHFDFDSSAVRASDQSKVQAVADYLKNNPADALEIEGHCDERGTEEYNRALGERRALALRTALAKLGVDPEKIDTTSYGKDRPAVPGHNEAAYKKNRRGEFLLETPPQKATP
ncbi:MAG TPA: OmpA family protein [Verrucomicrobiae bacterium]|nr:OmpA family protein [Verrucomicrobiae bacterium]